MTASLSDQDKLSRIEAAAYLTSKGHDMKTSTLAKLVATDDGPKFGKTENSRVFYLRADLDTWASAHPPKASGKPRANGNAARAQMIPPGSSRRLPIGVAALLREHILLADMFARGDATATTGFRFAASLDALRRLVS
jgi:hypothetical protein